MAKPKPMTHSKVEYGARQPVKTGGRVWQKPTFNQKRKAARGATIGIGAAAGAAALRGRVPGGTVGGAYIGGSIGKTLGKAAFPYKGGKRKHG